MDKVEVVEVEVVTVVGVVGVVESAESTRSMKLVVIVRAVDTIYFYFSVDIETFIGAVSVCCRTVVYYCWPCNLKYFHLRRKVSQRPPSAH